MDGERCFCALVIPLWRKSALQESITSFGMRTSPDIKSLVNNLKTQFNYQGGLVAIVDYSGGV